MCQVGGLPTNLDQLLALQLNARQATEQRRLYG